MDIKHITSDSLRRLLALTEKKEQLIKGIEDVENEIAKSLKGTATTVVEVAEAITPFKPAAKMRSKKSRKAKSGGLKERILALLEAAGDEGLRVKEIAEKLGSKAGNISVWFSTTGKSHTAKVEPGRYALKGAKSVAGATKPAAIVPKAGKPAKAKRKGGISPEGRAKLAASAKARWAAHRAAKSASAPAKKAFKLPKPAKSAKA